MMLEILQIASITKPASDEKEHLSKGSQLPSSLDPFVKEIREHQRGGMGTHIMPKVSKTIVQSFQARHTGGKDDNEISTLEGIIHMSGERAGSDL